MKQERKEERKKDVGKKMSEITEKASEKDTQSFEKQAYKVSFISIIANVILSLFKFAAGVFAHSGAMISDAVHSASDVLSTFVVIVGVKLSRKETDKEHPYGHERMECIAAIILAVILCATGIGIGYSGVRKIIGGVDSIVVPGKLALIAAIVSIVIKEAMYWYTMIVAKRINSSALKADAWHHRSDALSSIGSFIGILGAMLGAKILEPIASVVICIFIVKASIDIFRDAASKITDRACDDKTVDEIAEVCAKQEGVLSVDLVKTRLFGAMIYVDIEIGADKNITLEKAHDIAEKTHDAVEAYNPNIKHCMVHVNPK